jgi:uncharacterized protein (DUF433 family)
MPKVILAVSDLRSDLHAGLPDEELMAKYKLTPEGLKTLLDQVIRAIACGSSQVELETD